MKLLSSFLVAVGLIPSLSIARDAECPGQYELITRPRFEGLQARSIEVAPSNLSEGGDYTYFFDRRGISYLVVNQYGETGKNSAIFRFFDIHKRSYAVIFSRYAYSSPLYDDDSKVVSIRTESFLVCGGERVLGVGEAGGENEWHSAAGSILDEAIPKMENASIGGKK